MRASWLVLVVALYVSLDVANPLMPGAVTFGLEDPLDMRQAERLRGHDVAVQSRALPVSAVQAEPRPTQVIGLSAADTAPTVPPRGRRARSSLVAPAAPCEDH
jgi:hypothetical protein